MRGPVRFRHAVSEQNSRAVEGTRQTAHSVDAVLWEIGLVLGVFLGLALTIQAAWPAFGAN